MGYVKSLAWYGLISMKGALNEYDVSGTMVMATEPNDAV